VSALGRAYLIDANVLARVVAAPGDWRALLDGQRELAYAWSGYVLAAVLPYLGEKGIELMDSPHGMALSDALGASCFVLEARHRQFVDRLNASAHDPVKLREYFEQLNGAPAPGVEAAMLDGLTFLREVLSALNDATVGLLVIG
jgi:hypothetical protein